MHSKLCVVANTWVSNCIDAVSIAFQTAGSRESSRPGSISSTSTTPPGVEDTASTSLATRVMPSTMTGSGINSDRPMSCHDDGFTAGRVFFDAPQSRLHYSQRFQQVEIRVFASSSRPRRTVSSRMLHNSRRTARLQGTGLRSRVTRSPSPLPGFAWSLRICLPQDRRNGTSGRVLQGCLRRKHFRGYRRESRRYAAFPT